jgi:hypothetical protein
MCACSPSPPTVLLLVHCRYPIPFLINLLRKKSGAGALGASGRGETEVLRATNTRLQDEIDALKRSQQQLNTQTLE